MKLLRIALILAASVIAGLTAWRTYEEKQRRDDLWREAEEETR
ncbi:MAG: DLW-39 family protein [Dermabacter sp.]|nr:DLW-39 family protein [Dermabacter sp.]